MNIRPIRIVGDIAFVPLSKGMEAIIDAADVGVLKGRNWSALSRKTCCYAARVEVRDGRQKMLLLHREIMNAPNGMEVDHIDRNGLNNRRSNLRLCSHAENVCNRAAMSNSKSGVKGVSWAKREGKWKSEICFLGKRKFVGHFDDIEQARDAYLAAASKLHGEFAGVK